MIKGIIFDFDGTLFNTNDLIKESFSYSLKKVLNRDLEEGELREIWGEPLEDQMKYFNKKKWSDLVDTYRKFYHDHTGMMDTFPGALKTVRQLHNLGYKLAILTNKGKRGLIEGLQEFGMLEDIDFYLSKDDVNRSKPHPEGFVKIMERFDLNPEELLMVGDSPSDIIGGKNAGLKTVLVSYTYYEMEDMIALEPDYVIDHLEEVIELVEGCRDKIASL
ncbi:HAD family hydrolase [Halothermothrix orenii]|uniref:HAD-superfamily hydrolase, subfamily IA, variant 3 n=1 Tax=Halothermothrix orenii (strain H 168 / OCM 544 / DSM 9562) TaxID=373903 RepID=B8CZE6_HALOH|nr:HAD-IA family hydrolase [Halothermothrix orenii]ACL70665.1 HAD-superfamily hydrolase, subfamily IA, variant 3 [Halothermothrix orenii H 168]